MISITGSASLPWRNTTLTHRYRGSSGSQAICPARFDARSSTVSACPMCAAASWSAAAASKVSWLPASRSPESVIARPVCCCWARASWSSTCERFRVVAMSSPITGYSTSGFSMRWVAWASPRTASYASRASAAGSLNVGMIRSLSIRGMGSRQRPDPAEVKRGRGAVLPGAPTGARTAGQMRRANGSAAAVNATAC